MNPKPIILADGDCAQLQARFPAFDVLPMDADPARLVGREVTVMQADQQPASLRAVIEGYCRDKEMVLVRHIVDWLGIKSPAHEQAWNLRVVKELKAMGWGRVGTRRFDYGRLQTAYMPRNVPNPEPHSEPRWHTPYAAGERPRGRHAHG